MHIVNSGFNSFHDADFYIDRPNGSGDNLVVLLKTPAYFILDGKEVAAEKNSIIVFAENYPQLYRAKGPGFANDWFHFHFDEGDLPFFKELGKNYNTIYKLPDTQELSWLISKICYEHYSANIYKYDSTNMYCHLFFMKLSEKIHKPAKNIAEKSHYEKMALLRNKIYNMPDFDWNIEGMAHELTMSKSSFQHIYSSTFGISAMNDVINSRIEHAKYLLRNTDFTVKLIAEQCGYSAPIHFLRQFKRKTGLTPTEFREKNKLNN